MQTVRGRFNGTTVELIDEAPIDEDAYVLVTFLEGSMEMAAAREQRRAVSVAMYSLDRYREPLRKRMAIPSPTIDRQRPFSVGEVMTLKVVTAPSSANVMEAMRLMHQRGITSVIVEPDESGEGGIMTMRDVLKRIVT